MRNIVEITLLLVFVTGCTSVQTSMDYAGVNQPAQKPVAEHTYKFYPVRGEAYYGEVRR